MFLMKEGDNMMITLENLRHDANGCIRCSNCKWVDHIYMKSVRFARICPITQKHAFNLYSAPGLMYSALAIMDNGIRFTPALLDALYKCTSCGACDVRCKRNLDPEILSVIEALKAKAVEVGAGPMAEHRAVAKNIETTHNRYSAPHADRLNWLTEDIKPSVKADILYFVGCAASYADPSIARATARTLLSAGTDFMVSTDETCCGHLLYSTGQFDAFKRQAERNIKMLEQSGAKTVLLSCAEGYKTWKVDYPKILDKSTSDMNYNVVHITEHVDTLLKSGHVTFTKQVPLKVTYHDPCNLGRLSEPWYHWEGTYERYGVPNPVKHFRRDGHAGVYEPPRNILKSIPGIELVEMERMKENAWCCGGGSGAELAFPEFASWAASERIGEAKETGAEAIVTSCPVCKQLFQRTAKENQTNMKTYDMAEIIEKALP